MTLLEGKLSLLLTHYLESSALRENQQNFAPFHEIHLNLLMTEKYPLTQAGNKLTMTFGLFQAIWVLFWIYKQKNYSRGNGLNQLKYQIKLPIYEITGMGGRFLTHLSCRALNSKGREQKISPTQILYLPNQANEEGK